MPADTCILIFVRAPEKGKVKTRLARYLNEDVVLELYKRFAEDVIDAAGRSGHRIMICGHPPEALNTIELWLGKSHTISPQSGTDIGEKMANAIQDAFTHGCRRAILIGTDIPEIDEKIIDAAFEGLNSNSAVIGPARDGGYYLIGFRKSGWKPYVFKNIPWSTDQVFDITMSRFREQNTALYVLPELLDIDTMGDLELFAASAEKKGLTHLKTFRFLSFLHRTDNHDR